MRDPRQRPNCNEVPIITTTAPQVNNALSSFKKLFPSFIINYGTITPMHQPLLLEQRCISNINKDIMLIHMIKICFPFTFDIAGTSWALKYSIVMSTVSDWMWSICSKQKDKNELSCFQMYKQTNFTHFALYQKTWSTLNRLFHHIQCPWKQPIS